LLISPKIKTFLVITQFILIIFGAYIVMSLFEVWAWFPFWVKNLALVTSLGVIYWFTRKTLRHFRKVWLKNPGDIRFATSIPLQKPQWPLHMVSVLVLGLLIWGGLSVGAGLPGRIIQAMTINLTQPPREVLLTVSVSPPDYLNQADTVLFDGNDGYVSKISAKRNLTFPEGSIITIEVADTENYAPFISLGNSLGKNQKDADGRFRSQHILQDNSTLDIKVGPYVSIRQGFTVIPDQPPTIKFSATPEVTTRDSFEFRLAIGDDHGIVETYLELTRRGIQKNQSDIIRLPVSGHSNGEVWQTFYLNLLSHQWAGTRVKGVVKAVDGLGQISETEAVFLNLPEKTFQNPVAKNLASIRKSLIITPERKNAQIRRLDLLTNDKAAYQNDISIYLSLRSAYWKLRSAETEEDLNVVTRYLWQTALKVEGDGSFEEQNILTLIGQIKMKLIAGAAGTEIDMLIGGLHTRMEVMVDKEFMLFSRRLSLNEELEETTLPGFIAFKTLISTLRSQVEEGDFDAASKTLTTFQALFEQRPVPKFQ